MRLPRSGDEELWIRALAKVAIEAAEALESPSFGDVDLLRFALFWMDECAEIAWRGDGGKARWSTNGGAP